MDHYFLNIEVVHFNLKISLEVREDEFSWRAINQHSVWKQIHSSAIPIEKKSFLADYWLSFQLKQTLC